MTIFARTAARRRRWMLHKGSNLRALRDSHIVLTGAAGFLGVRVMRLLVAEGATVTAIVRDIGCLDNMQGVRLITADLASDFSSSLARVGGVDGVVHLAQAGGWNAFPVNAGNITAVSVAATTRLAEYAVAHGANTFVLASSGGIYGPSADPIREDGPMRPTGKLGFYLAAKVAAETLLVYFAPHVKIQRLRYFFIYGDGQRQEFLIARIKGAIERGDPVRLAAGRGPRLNPVHVDDAARATVAALKYPDALVANIAGPETGDLATIAKMIAIGTMSELNAEVTNEQPQDFVGDISLMSRVLGPPQIGLSAGLSRLGPGGRRSA